MIKCVLVGQRVLHESERDMIVEPLARLASWDFKYHKTSHEASIFEAWEFMIATYMHEKKIEDVRVRRNLWSIGEAPMFFFRQVSQWADQEP